MQNILSIPVRAPFAGARAGDFRFACLVMAVLVYGAAGSPTPDHPGVVEILTGLLLCCGAGSPAIRNVFQKNRGNTGIRPAGFWPGAARVLLIFGLCVPVIMGAVQGHAASLMLRDLAPFLFMLLPLFCFDLFIGAPARFEIFLKTVLVSGWLFALRAVMDAAHISLPGLGSAGELYYFANAPTVLLAAMLPPALAGENFIRRFTVRGFLVFAVAGLLAVVPLIAMGMTLQRASIGLAALYFIILAVSGMIRAPGRAWILLAPVLLAGLPFAGIAGGVLGLLAEKTSQVGFNMRFQEFEAVWREITGGGGLGAVFGMGWGGTFASPAVGGVRVNYTHCLLSSALLKTGIAGLVLTCAYLAGLAERLWPLLFSRPVLALALAGPLAIDVFLYASFKSLDFGLLLLLIAATGGAAARPSEVASGA